MAIPTKNAQGNWRIQIEIKGVRESATHPTKRQAIEWATMRTAQIRADAGGKTNSYKTVGDALREYAEKISPTKRGEVKEQIRLLAIPKHKGFPLKIAMADVRPAHFAHWRDCRLKEVSGSTVTRDMTLISHVMSIAHKEWGWLETNPLSLVRRPAEPEHRERLFSGIETRQLLRVMDWSRKPATRVRHAVANAMLLALQTGMRAGEICALTWDDIRQDHCVLKTSKTGRGRLVPLTPTARRTIELMQGYNTHKVFGMDSKHLDTNFRNYKSRLDITDLKFHDSRHTAATRLAQKLHVLELCKVFGWTKTTQALTYFNASASDIAKRMT